MFNRLLKLPLKQKSSIFLFGPRGTGKTSWIKSHLPDAIYFDLLDFPLFNSFSSNPSRLEKLIPQNYDNWIIIDEVQKVPELLNQVHRLIESKKLKFLLTGSSARSLRRKGTNLLAGRALRYHMHPLVAQEIGASFDLNHALKYGLLPSAVTHEDPKKYLETYVQTYLKEEILQESIVRNIGSFTRFLEVASFSQGNVLNFSEIARELYINRLLVATYFEILEDLLLGIRIPVFNKRAKRKTIAHSKFYFFDAGVYRILKQKGPLDSDQEDDGAALETIFLQSLRALNDYLELDYKIYFWRTMAQNEVDFVIYGPHGLYAFEIKRTAHITSKSMTGLRAFKDDYPEAKLYLLFMGDRREYHNDITAIPFLDALKELENLIGFQQIVSNSETK